MRLIIGFKASHNWLRGFMRMNTKPILKLLAVMVIETKENLLERRNVNSNSIRI